ncbi:MAG TPA: FkbM family methyltransferase [Longimicrobiales bacterium]|nr:FkbM family methyltransferase [Longimicrobiales bacterium]
MSGGLGLVRPVEGAERASVRLALGMIGLAEIATWPLGHRRFLRLCRYASEILDAHESIVVRLAPGARIRVDLDDPYWLRLVARRFRYEPEVEHVLRRLADVRFSFVDCGANIGYWSVLASSPEFGAHAVTAIEASGRLCERLRENSDLNGSRFGVVHAAVAEAGGRRAWLETGDSHAAASIHGVRGTVTSREEVRTVALDDLELEDPVVIKLDVEGAEIEAMHGAGGLLARGALLVYEDHGRDTTCRHTRAALDLGLAVYSISLRGRIERVHDVDAVRRAKHKKNRGYNLLALRPDSPFTPRLEA